VWQAAVERFLNRIEFVDDRLRERLDRANNLYSTYDSQRRTGQGAVPPEINEDKNRLTALAVSIGELRSRSTCRLAQIGRERDDRSTIDRRIEQLQTGFSLVRRLRNALVVSLLVGTFSLIAWPVHYWWLNLPVAVAVTTIAACQVWHSVSWWDPPDTGWPRQQKSELHDLDETVDQAAAM
jgi:hypothetical protein